jgi:hypothetical protein
MKDKLLNSFDSMFVYDTTIETNSKGEFYCNRKKIKVEREILAHGAVLPTWEVKYPDNGTAYISKTVYSASPQAADALYLQSLYEIKINIDKQLLKVQKNQQEIIDKIHLLTGLMRDGYDNQEPEPEQLKN